MVSSSSIAFIVFISLIVPSTLAGVICEDLPQDLCAFAVSATSKRCLLESYHHSGGQTEYQCRTSEVVVEKMADWVETDECVHECGVDRNMVGISSDALLEPQFTEKLCSVTCYQNCPNIIDLYLNLAAGEGVFLPQLCEAQRTNPHRAMLELLSSGAAAAPVGASAALAPAGAYDGSKWDDKTDAPALAPAYAYAPEVADGPSFSPVYAEAPTVVEAPADSPVYAEAPIVVEAPADSPVYAEAPTVVEAPADSPVYAEAPILVEAPADSPVYV